MKLKSFMTCCLAAVALAACSSKKEAAQSEQAEAPRDMASLSGTYNIYTVNVSGSEAITPAEATPDAPSTMTFADGQYTVKTNCNTIQGDYTVQGDSIHFSEGLMTMMDCPDTRLENMMARVLPMVNKVVVLNDSVTRLDSDGPSYIVLTAVK